MRFDGGCSFSCDDFYRVSACKNNAKSLCHSPSGHPRVPGLFCTTRGRLTRPLSRVCRRNTLQVQVAVGASKLPYSASPSCHSRASVSVSDQLAPYSWIKASQSRRSRLRAMAGERDLYDLRRLLSGCITLGAALMVKAILSHSKAPVLPLYPRIQRRLYKRA